MSDGNPKWFHYTDHNGIEFHLNLSAVTVVAIREGRIGLRFPGDSEAKHILDGQIAIALREQLQSILGQ